MLNFYLEWGLYRSSSTYFKKPGTGLDNIITTSFRIKRLMLNSVIAYTVKFNNHKFIVDKGPLVSRYYLTC